MASLFEINHDLMALWDAAVDPDTGEINEDLLADFEILHLERDAKIENIGCWVKNLTADAEAMKAEAKAMTERARSAERKAESLKRYLAAALHGEKFSSPRLAISWRRSTSVTVAEHAVLPEEFLRRKITEEPAKDEIKKALAAGIAVPGCSLVENNNIVIK